MRSMPNSPASWATSAPVAKQAVALVQTAAIAGRVATTVAATAIAARVAIAD